MGDWLWLAIGLGLVAAVEVFGLVMDIRRGKRLLAERERERTRPRIVPAVERDLPPPIDFSEALRRRGRR